MTVSSYVPGEWTGVVRDGFVAVLGPTTEHRTAADLWAGGQSGASFIDGLSVLASAGFGAMPPFALAVRGEGGTTHVAVRGGVAVDAVLDGRPEVVTVDGAGVSTWNERSLAGVTAMAVRVLDAPTGPGLPLVAGVVRLGGLTSPQGATFGATEGAQTPAEAGDGDADADPLPAPHEASDESHRADGSAGSPAVTSRDAPTAAVPGLEPDVGSSPGGHPDLELSEAVPGPSGAPQDDPADDADAPGVDGVAVTPPVPVVGAADAQPRRDGADAEPIAGMPAPESEDDGSPADPSPVEPEPTGQVGEPHDRHDADRHDHDQHDVDRAWSVQTASTEAVPSTGSGESAPTSQETTSAPTASDPDLAPPTYPPAFPVGDGERPTQVSGRPGGGLDSSGSYAYTIMSESLADVRGAMPVWGGHGESPAPARARLVLSTGLVVDLDRPVLLGRAPQASRGTSRDLPRLVAVPSPQQDISRTHAEVRMAGEDALITDLDSTNGVHVLRPGGGARRLRPGEPRVLADDETIDLGDGVTFIVEHIG